MITNLPGSSEDLIQRCAECEYCIFEDILSEEYRKVKVLESPIPEDHVHRGVIEQICGRNYDQPCYMKYAAMRSMYDDFMASQMGTVKDFIFDLGKRKRRKVEYEEGMREWTRNQNFGREKPESYAERFRDVWNLGLRKTKQILTPTQMYEIAVAKPEVYSAAMGILEKLKKESDERDAL